VIIKNKYEPLEKFLDVVYVDKKVNIVCITLSFEAIDVNHYGY
jgi:hypothetical protein